MTGFCLDAGALIAVERGNNAVLRLLRRAREAGGAIAIPAGVVGQAWRAGGPRQAKLARFLGADDVSIAALDESVGRAIGELCALTGGTDVVDAHVALHARLHRMVVLTSDPDDIAVFGPGLEIIAL